MNTFNKKSLYAAIAGVSALGVTGTAEAVHVNPDGLGQVLIYPYYTVRTRVAARRSTSVHEPAVQLAAVGRELDGVGEGRQGPLPGRQGLPRSAGLQPVPVGARRVDRGHHPDGRRRAASSRSTSPARRRSSRATVASPTQFVNYAYTGTNADGADTSLDRTREGYVEIIEMGDVTGATATRRHARRRRSAVHGRPRRRRSPRPTRCWAPAACSAR